MQRGLRVCFGLAFAVACAAEPPPPKAAEEPLPTAPPPAAPVEVPDASVAVADAAPAAPDAASPSWDDELAWAKQRWAKDLAGVETRSPVAALVAWVAGDKETDVWVTAEGIQCRPGKLAKTQAGADFPLALSVVLDETKIGAVRRRRVTSAEVGQNLRLPRSSTTLEQQPDGSWNPVGGQATSGASVYAALSSVSADSARFEGQWLEIKAECPEEQLPCGDSGTRACVTCRDVSLKIAARVFYGGRASASVTLSSCKEPCPPRVDNPDLPRAQRLFDAIEPFRVQAAGGSMPAGIHRTLAACRAGSKPRVK